MTPGEVRGWLAGLQQACDAATLGPWNVVGDHDEVKAICGPLVVGPQIVSMEYLADDVEHDADATFIASSRSSVPALIAMVTAVLDLCDEAERGALRWENPLPVPEWVGSVRAALAAATGDQT